MYKLSTGQWRFATVLLAAMAGARIHAQAVPSAVPNAVPNVDWRRIGNSVVDEALAGLASGPVSRIWYGPGGVL